MYGCIVAVPFPAAPSLATDRDTFFVREYIVIRPFAKYTRAIRTTSDNIRRLCLVLNTSRQGTRIVHHRVREPFSPAGCARCPAAAATEPSRRKGCLELLTRIIAGERHKVKDVAFELVGHLRNILPFHPMGTEFVKRYLRHSGIVF